jgi:putative transcription factor
MCGSPIRGKPFRALVDGVEMVLCSSCYNKLIKSGRALPAPEKKIQAKEEKKKKRFDKIGNQLEIIDGFGEEIKKGRESKGWTQSILAQKLRISEAMLKKIEQEKMKPSIDLAKKIEQLLKIKLLQPVEYDEGESESSSQDKVTFGDVVVVRRDED